MPVLPLSDLKKHLNITSNTYDDELESMIAAAEAAIAKRVGPLEPTTVTATVSGSGALTLPVYPVLSLTSVTDAGGTSVPLLGITTDLASGVLTGSGGAGIGSSTYTVVYSAGRATCPPDLLMAVLELVRHFWDTQRGPTRRPGSTASDAASNTIPGAAYMFPFRVEQLLAPHEQYGFA